MAFVEAEKEKEQRPDLEMFLIKAAKDELDLLFQKFEANVNGEYRFDYITWEEAQQRRKALEKRPVVRFGKLMIDGKSWIGSGACNSVLSVSQGITPEVTELSSI
jgi:hypothetical protein